MHVHDYLTHSQHSLHSPSVQGEVLIVPSMTLRRLEKTVHDESLKGRDIETGLPVSTELIAAEPYHEDIHLEGTLLLGLSALKSLSSSSRLISSVFESKSFG